MVSASQPPRPPGEVRSDYRDEPSPAQSASTLLAGSIGPWWVPSIDEEFPDNALRDVTHNWSV